jgi:peptidylprolyl isomerase
VTSKKRNRSQARAQRAAEARRAAELARQKQVRKRRMTIGGFVAMVAVVAVLAILLIGGGGGGSKSDQAAAPSTTLGSSTTSEAAKASVAGKPCVPVADPLPAGAPAVPVKVGPPPTALIMEDLKPGTGAVVTAGQTLTVNYIGVSCSTGKIFDSSYKTKQPATFPLGNVIPGWQKGIPGMKVGGQRLLGIPPDQGYGDRGGGSDIAPGETLWFVVEVLDAKAA